MKILFNQSKFILLGLNFHTTYKAITPVLSCRRVIIIVKLDPFINMDMLGHLERRHQFPILIQRCWLLAWLLFYCQWTINKFVYLRQKLQSVFCLLAFEISISFMKCFLPSLFLENVSVKMFSITRWKKKKF